MHYFFYFVSLDGGRRDQGFLNVQTRIYEVINFSS